MIHFDRVAFRFAGARDDQLILSEFELAIAKGEFHLVLGPSGCGKTTALNLLAGFEQPTQGTVKVDGNSVAGPGLDRIVIFQGDDSLYPWLTAIENIEFGLRMQNVAAGERHAKARESLAMVGLSGHEGKFPGELS